MSYSRVCSCRGIINRVRSGGAYICRIVSRSMYDWRPAAAAAAAAAVVVVVVVAAAASGPARPSSQCRSSSPRCAATDAGSADGDDAVRVDSAAASVCCCCDCCCLFRRLYSSSLQYSGIIDAVLIDQPSYVNNRATDWCCILPRVILLLPPVDR